MNRCIRSFSFAQDLQRVQEDALELSARPSSKKATWLSSVLLLLGFGAITPSWAIGYVADGAFNGGQYYADAFASDSALPHHDYAGRKIAQAANGDLIVAALVDESFHYPDQHGAIGLIRYNAAGVRMPWSNPDPVNTRHGNHYLFVPTSSDVGSIDAIQVVDGKIVLVYTWQVVYDNPTAVIARVVVIGDDGRVLWSDVLYDCGGNASCARGGATASYKDASGTYVVFASTLGVDQPTYRRYGLEASGHMTLLDDRWLETSACWNVAWQCLATGMAVSQDTPSSPPRIYLGYAFRANDYDDYDVVVSRIDAHGIGDPTWDPNNVHWNIADGGSRDDVPVGIALRRTAAPPYRDEIFVAARSARACAEGIGLIKFDHEGRLVSRTLTGGECFSISGRGSYEIADIPAGFLIDANRIVVFGSGRVSHFRTTTATTVKTDARLSVFDFDLALQSQAMLPFPIGAARQRDSWLFGGTSTPSGVALTGYLAYPTTAGSNLAGKQQVGSIRVRYVP